MNINETLANLRGTYLKAALDIADCDPNPEHQFDNWFKNAVIGECDEPNAFTLSTIHEGRPRARVVLLKGIHEGKLVFYTNYSSAKGSELSHNSNVAMTFLWLPLQRQIRIEGTIQKVDPALSDEYFAKRPRGSQVGAIASPQSKKVDSREELERYFREAETNAIGKTELIRPAHWGGYAVDPNYFEFWQGRDNRMHDRITYQKISGIWHLGRLAP
jgi:pyridoxamine 5'-phosphate oxidase